MTYRVPARTAALSLWCAHTKARCPTNTALRATHVVVVYTCKGCAARSKRAVYFFLQINCKHSPPIGVFSWVTCESILFAVGGCSITLFFLLRHQSLNFYPLIFAPHFLLCCDIVQHYTAGWGRAAIGSREGEAACRGFSEAACRDFSEAVCRGLSEAACRGFGGGARQCEDTISTCPGHRCCHRGGRQRREAASSCHGGGWQRRCRLQKRQSGKAGIRPGQEQAQFGGAVGDREGG